MPKLKVISLFAGAGGVDVGFKKAGFEIIWANDFDENAVNTFKLNLGDHIVLGDITQISSDQIPNDVDVITGGFPCFVAGTKIYTEQGYKNIEDIVVGDPVLTHKNRFQKVVIRMVNQTREIYKIKAMGIPEIGTTHNHPFYVMQKDWSEPQWIDAKDLNKKHYLSIPINNYSKLPSWNGIETVVNQFKTKNKNQLSSFLDKHIFWWFVGRYLADGWLINYPKQNRKNSQVYKVYLSAGKHEKEAVEKQLNLLNLHYTIDEDESVYKYIFSNEEFYYFLLQFGKYAYGKTITSDMLNLPKDLLKSFLDGYLSGDGTFHKSTESWRFATVSKTLAYGIQQIIYKVYETSCAIYKIQKPEQGIIQGRTVSLKTEYQGSFKLNKTSSNSFIKDGFLWLPFRTKEILVKDATVYNFEVEEDNSYTANNAVVHNCQGFSVANTKRSIDDKRNFLYKELLRVVKDKKPKYFIAENVKGLLSLSGGLVMKMIEDDFREIGYNMNYRLLNSADYGVPQLRERVIIIGNRLGLPNPFPEPTHMKQERDNDNLFSFVSNLLPHRTVKNSISYLENIETVERNSNQIIEINGKKIHNHIAYTNVDNIFWKREGDTTQEEICDYLKYWRDKKGISTKRIDEIFGYRHTAGHWFRKDNNSGSIPKPSDWWKLKEILGFDDKYDKFVTNLVEKEIIFEQSLRITNWNRPSDTITASTPEIHINKKRRLSVRECAILQTFPDDFIFTGSLSAQHRQVGNAVPPLLAEKIALEIKKVLEKQ